MKNILFLAISLLGFGFMQCQAQNKPQVQIKGKIRTPQATGMAYFQQINDQNIGQNLDSTKIGKDGSFSFKKSIDEPGYYAININKKQTIGLVLEGNESLQIETDGFDTPDKPNTTTIKGSKTFDAFQTTNKNMADFRQKVVTWQMAYQKATQEQNTMRAEEIKQDFENELQSVLSSIKKTLPEMGTSLVAITTVNNFLQPEKDLESFENLAKQLKEKNIQHKYAKRFQARVAQLKGTSIGTEAADFEVKDLTGKRIKLSDLRGKVVIVDFWATWCGPCIASFPGMQLAVDKYKNNPDVKFLFINTFERMTPEEIPAHISNFVKQKNLKLDFYLDDSGAAAMYGVQGIPTKFVIDKHGKLSSKGEGYAGSPDAVLQEMTHSIDEALKK